MASYRWQIGSHQVRFEGSRWPGWREVWLDDTLLHRERSFLNAGIRHYLTIDGEEYELAGARHQGGQFDYFLLRAGEPIPSLEEEAAGVTADDLRRYPAMGHPNYWRAVASESGLDYFCSKRGHFWYRHRLFGRIDERLISVHLDRPGGSKVMVSLMAHFPPQESDLKALKLHLMADQRVTELVGSRYQLDQRVGVAPAHLGLYLPYQPQIQPPEALAEAIQLFAGIVSEVSQPLPLGWCAESQQYRDVVIARMNGFPVQMAPELLQERQAAGEDALTSERTLSGRTLFALLLGVVAGALSGFGWAMATLSVGGDLNSTVALAATILGPVAVAIVVRLIYAASGLRAAWLWPAATGFVVLGLAVATVWAVRAQEALAAERFGPESVASLPLFVIVAIVLATWYGLRGWRNQREQLKVIYTPEIELLPAEISQKLAYGEGQLIR